MRAQCLRGGAGALTGHQLQGQEAANADPSRQVETHQGPKSMESEKWEVMSIGANTDSRWMRDRENLQLKFGSQMNHFHLSLKYV